MVAVGTDPGEIAKSSAFAQAVPRVDASAQQYGHLAASEVAQRPMVTRPNEPSQIAFFDGSAFGRLLSFGQTAVGRMRATTNVRFFRPKQSFAAA